MAWLSGILEIIKFLSWLTPALEALYGRFKEYRRKERENELRDAIRLAFESGDTRKLEEMIGNPNAGKPTRHNIPDLKTRPAKDRGGSQ